MTAPKAVRRTAADKPGDDPRYHTSKWQRVRAIVLRRDLWTCRIVAGCLVRATVADHIVPVHPGMRDDLFYGRGNLRAGCRPHNLARGFELSAEVGGSAGDRGVVTGDYS